MRHFGVFAAGGKVELGLCQSATVEFVEEKGEGPGVRLRKESPK